MIESIWLLAIAIIPIFFNPFSVSNFEPDKAALLKAFALLLLSAWSLKKISSLIALRSKSAEHLFSYSPSAAASTSNLQNDALWVAVLVYICSYVISSFSSVSTSLSIFGSFERQLGLISMLAAFTFFIVLATHLRKVEQLERIVDALLLGSIPVSIYAIFQRLGVDPLPWGDLVQGRSSSNLGNPIFLGAYLLMVFPFALFRLLWPLQINSVTKAAAPVKNNRASMIFYIILLALHAAALCCSGSRGPLLGWIVEIFVFSFCFLWRLHRSIFRAFSLSLLAVLIAAPLILYFSNSITQSHVPFVSGRGVQQSHPCDFCTNSKLGLGAVKPTPPVLSSSHSDASVLELDSQACTQGCEKVFHNLLSAQKLQGLNLQALEKIRQEFCDKALLKKDSVFLGTIGLSSVLDLACKSSELSAQEDIVARQGTVRVRELLWESAYKMLRSTAAVEDATSTSDRLSVFRPFIGYGPDTLALVFGPFYPAEMSNLERNKFLDRLHNQTWQVWADQGVFGLCAYFVLLFSFFLGALRLITEKRVSSLALFLISFTGATLAAFLWASFKSAAYIGIGISSGFLCTLFCAFFCLARAGNKTQISEPAPKQAALNNQSLEAKLSSAYRATFSCTVLSAMVGHFVELQFGMLIIPTLMLFWILLGLLVGLGSIENCALSDGRVSDLDSRWLMYWAFFLALILSTISFCMIATPPTEGLSWKSVAEFVFSGPGWIILLSSIMGNCLLWFNKERPVKFAALTAAFLISLLPALIVALFEMKSLLASSSFMAHSLAEVQSNVWSIANLPVRFVILLLCAAIGLGVLASYRNQEFNFRLRETGETEGAQSLSVWQSRLWQGLAVLCVSFVAMSFISVLCIKQLQAAAFAKSARAFADKGKWDASALLYREAIALSLNSDFYQQDLSQRLSQLAQQTAASNLTDLLFDNALLVAKSLQQLRPLSAQSNGNIAHIYAAWAEKTEDAALKEKRISQADFFYAEALKLMPEGVYYWIERARLLQNSVSGLPSAGVYAERALKLAPLNLQANLVYAQVMEQQAALSGNASMQENRETIIAYLERALMISLFTDQAESFNYFALCKALSQLYALLGDGQKEALYAQVAMEE